MTNNNHGKNKLGNSNNCSVVQKLAWTFSDGLSPSYSCNLAIGASCLVEIVIYLTLPLSDLEFEVSEPKYFEVKKPFKLL